MQMGSHGGQDSSTDDLLEAHYQAWSVGLNYMPSMALRCALQLGIPDIISRHDDRPVTLPELVAQLSIPPAKSPYLRRVMQLLVHLGYFTTQKNDQNEEGYALMQTSKSKLLVSGNPHTHDLSLASFFLSISDPARLGPSFHMADWFRGPHSSPFEATHGISLDEYVEKHPEFDTVQNNAIAIDSELEMKGLLKHLIPKLEGFVSLVDAGGGIGAVAEVISEAAPHLKCTVFDLPRVISQAKPKHNSNLTFLAGDLLEFIPSAEIIFFRGVLAVFSDEKCAKILVQCHRAVGSEKNRGKVIIVEYIVDQTKESFESTKLQLCFDLLAVNQGSKGRNETEWKKLFLEAGFTDYKITPTSSIMSIIEVFP